MKIYQNFGIIFFVILVLSELKGVLCGNILFFLQVSTYSHRIVIWPLADALADKGHNVTFLHIEPPKEILKTKVREFYPESIRKKLNGSTVTEASYLNVRLEQGRFGTAKAAFLGLPLFGASLCSGLLNAPEIDPFLSSEKFDLIVIDALFNECAYGLAYHFKAKTIAFGTSHPFSWNIEAQGTIQETSVFPELHTSFQYPMTFFQRTFSTIWVPLTYYLKVWFYYPKLDQIFQEKFGNDIPPVQQLERDTSLVLYNSHFSEEDARALPPMFIPVGGIHCSWAHDSKAKAKPIPQDVKKFVDESGENGFIYVSFGSEARISETPLEFQKIFYTAFANAKTRFIWKWEGEKPSGLPKNVLSSGWLPQEQILAHKKCRGFITHGGLLGIQEAISHGVPMISLPIFAEQDLNSFRLERTGRGIRLEPGTLTLEQLQHAIAQLLTNPMYKENVVEASRLFRDRPQKPIDTAIYWTEYILRHSDTSSLKPIHALQQYWFQKRLLDVWAFIFLVLFTFSFTIIFLFNRLFRCIFCRHRSTYSQLRNASSSKSAKKSKASSKKLN